MVPRLGTSMSTCWYHTTRRIYAHGHHCTLGRPGARPTPSEFTAAMLDRLLRMVHDDNQ